MRKQRTVKRLAISRETLLHLTARQAAGGATETCFATCPVTCADTCLDYETCTCTGPTYAPVC